jgi:hypothetical protein
MELMHGSSGRIFVDQFKWKTALIIVIMTIGMVLGYAQSHSLAGDVDFSVFTIEALKQAGLKEKIGLLSGFTICIVSLSVMLKKLKIVADTNVPGSIRYDLTGLHKYKSRIIRKGDIKKFVLEVSYTRGNNSASAVQLRPIAIMVSGDRLLFSLHYLPNIDDVRRSVLPIAEYVSTTVGDLLNDSVNDLLSQKQKLMAIVLLTAYGGFDKLGAVRYLKKLEG